MQGCLVVAPSRRWRPCGDARRRERLNMCVAAATGATKGGCGADGVSWVEDGTFEDEVRWSLEARLPVNIGGFRPATMLIRRPLRRLHVIFGFPLHSPSLFTSQNGLEMSGHTAATLNTMATDR